MAPSTPDGTDGKDAVGTEVIAAREQTLWQHAVSRWVANPAVEALGNAHAARLSIVSVRIRHLDDGPTGPPADFGALRWFPLPPSCLAGDGTGSSGGQA